MSSKRSLVLYPAAVAYYMARTAFVIFFLSVQEEIFCKDIKKINTNKY
jgi:hypothetical protein